MINNKQHRSGFTLLELLVSLAIMTLVLAIGIPSFKSLIDSSRLETQSYDISMVFSLARMEAVDKGTTMTVCSSNNQATCRADANKNNWADGWILFRDINANGVVDTPDCSTELNDCVIKVWSALSGASVLTANTNFVDFASDGRLNSATMTLTLTADTAVNCGVNQKRTFSLSATGKVTTVNLDC